MRTVRTILTKMTIGLCFLGVSLGYAADGRWSMGLAGGKVWSVEGTARQGEGLKYHLERFNNAETPSANLGYLWEFLPYNYVGPELTVQNYELVHSQKAFPTSPAGNVGKLDITPILLSLKMQAFPRKGTGFGGHFDLGAGVAISDYDSGPSYFVTATTLEVVTRESAIYTIAGGLDYFFTKHLAAKLTARYIYGSIDHTWRSLAGTETGDFETKFNISHAQLLIGIQAYF